MTIHHLNCGTMCPLSPRLTSGSGSLFGRGRFVTHCLLIETERDGLILVDTGVGTLDCRDPSRFPAALKIMGKPTFDLAETAVEQVRALGHDPDDVRHILVTHLDLDHAGGFPDFPRATVHVHDLERERAFARPTGADRQRYLPHHWAHGATWETYSESGERWFGFDAVRQLRGLPDSILLIPTHGHSQGHCAIAVQRPDGGWLLHCGDAYFHHDQIAPHDPSCPAGLRLFQRAAQWNHTARVANIARLQRLNAEHGDEIDIFCSHDPHDHARLAAGTP